MRIVSLAAGSTCVTDGRRGRQAARFRFSTPPDAQSAREELGEAATRGYGNDMNAIVKNTDKFIDTEVDDEIVIVSLDDGEMYSLKDTGRAIWQMIDGQRSDEEIFAKLAESFDVSREQAVTEGKAFLEQLRSAALIKG